MAEKILLVEDEEKLARMVEMELRYEGYEVTKAFDGRSGLEEALSGKYDLVLLDIMLPVMDGWSVLKKIRESDRTPVIMLTAKGELGDKVLGLESGADDYIVKPFEMKEVLARIHAVLRRFGGEDSRDDELQRAERLRQLGLPGPRRLGQDRHRRGGRRH